MENLKPLRQSNFSTARINPRFPSWIRSSRSRLPPVSLGDRDHQAQVGADEGHLGLVALGDETHELDRSALS